MDKAGGECFSGQQTNVKLGVPTEVAGVLRGYVALSLAFGSSLREVWQSCKSKVPSKYQMQDVYKIFAANHKAMQPCCREVA